MQSWKVLTIVICLGISCIVYILILEISLLLRFVMNKLRNRQGKAGLLTKRVIIVHSLTLVGMGCFLYGYFIEPYWIEIKTVNIYTEKFKDISLKIIQISDLHCDKNVRNENKIVSIINSLKPDIIVFTGDCLNTLDALPKFKDTMKKLKADIGKYAVLGNIDFWCWDNSDLFGNTGFQVLDKGNIKLVKNGETFYISGLNCKYPDTYYEVLKSIPGNNYSIFLYHYPDLVEDLKEINVDLYLAGHTHGGQVAIPFYGALITLSKYGKKYESGKYTVGNTILYVNRGIGMEGGNIPRVRFCARPEITIFNLKPKR